MKRERVDEIDLNSYEEAALEQAWERLAQEESGSIVQQPTMTTKPQPLSDHESTLLLAAIFQAKSKGEDPSSLIAMFDNPEVFRSRLRKSSPTT